MIQSQGTAVGRAIDKCITGFDENSNASKVILVLTDGENYEDDLVAAARNAKNTGATVHFIGCGTTNGGPIPDLDSKGRQIGYLQDVNGQIVVSKLDHQILSESAQTGGGIYMRTGNSQDVLKPFLNFKGNLEQSSMATIKFVDFDHQFMPWLLVALGLLLLEILLPRRKRPTIKLSSPVLLVILFSNGNLIAGQTIAKEQFKEGAQALAQGQFEEAASLYASVEDDPIYGPSAHYNRGCVLFREAVAHDHNPTDSISVNRFSQALLAFQKAIEASEDPGLLEDAHFNASLSAMQIRQPRMAIEHAKSTLRINPSHDDARKTMALARRMMEQDEQQQQDKQQAQDEQKQKDGKQQDEQQQQDGQQQEGQQQQQDGQQQQQDGQQQQQDGQQQEGQQQQQDGQQQQGGQQQDEQQQQDGQQQEGQQQQQDGQQQEGQQQQQDGQQQQQDGQQQQQDGQQQQQDGQQQDEQQQQDGQQNYKMSARDMERILEAIERQEAIVRGKIRAAESKKTRQQFHRKGLVKMILKLDFPAMALKAVWIVSIAVLGSLTSIAQNASVDLSIDKTIVSTGDVIQLTVNLMNCNTNVEPLEIEGLRFIGGPFTSRSQSWINGVNSSEIGVTWQYLVASQSDIDIPRFTWDTNQGIFESDPIRITVAGAL